MGVCMSGGWWVLAKVLVIAWMGQEGGLWMCVLMCVCVCVCVCVCAFTVHERMISFSAHTPEYTAGLSPLPTQRYAPTHPLTCSNRSQRTMERRTDSALSHLNRR